MHQVTFKTFLAAFLVVLSLSGCATGPALPSGVTLDPSGACFPTEFEPPKNVRYIHRTLDEINEMYRNTEEGKTLARNHKQALAFNIPGLFPIVVLPSNLTPQRIREGWTIALLKKHEDGHILELTIHDCLEEFRKNPQILNTLVKRVPTS